MSEAGDTPEALAARSEIGVTQCVNLYAMRKKRGWSLDRLAKESGLSKSYLWELEKCRSKRPSHERISRVAEALQTTPDALYGKEGDHMASLRYLAIAYDRLSPSGMKIVREVIETLLRNGEARDASNT